MKLDLEKIASEMRVLVANNVDLLAKAEKHFEQSGEQQCMVLDISNAALWYLDREMHQSKYLECDLGEFAVVVRDGLTGMLSGPYGSHPLVWDGDALRPITELSQDSQAIIQALAAQAVRPPRERNKKSQNIGLH